MTKYIEVTMIFEPENGSTLDIDALKEAVMHSVELFAPEPDAVTVAMKDTEDADETTD